MPNWVKCTEHEGNVVRDHSATVFVNLDTVRYMIGNGESTALYFGSESPDHENMLSVHESPEEIMSSGSSHLKRP